MSLHIWKIWEGPLKKAGVLNFSVALVHNVLFGVVQGTLNIIGKGTKLGAIVISTFLKAFSTQR